MQINNDTVTYEWRGLSAPQIIGDFNNWEIKRAIRLTRSAKNFWTRVGRGVRGEGEIPR